MGFFSWTCAKTNMPIMASTSWAGHPFTKVVLLADGGRTVVKGTYDGYGRMQVGDAQWGDTLTRRSLVDIVGHRLSGKINKGEVKLVLAKYYDPSDDFQSLGRSRNEPGQGHFHNEGFLGQCQKVGSFATYEGYCLAFEGQLPVDFAARLSAKDAAGFEKLKHKVAKALTDERMRRVNAAVDGQLPERKWFSDSWLVLVPAKDGGNAFKVRGRDIYDEENDHATDDLARIDVGSGRISAPALSKCARDVLDACPPTAGSQVKLVRDGEPLAVVRDMTSALCDKWVEVIDPEGCTHAFWRIEEAVAHLGLDDRERHLLYNARGQSYEDRKKRLVTVEMPSLEAAPTM